MTAQHDPFSRNRARTKILTSFVCVLILVTALQADVYDISWYTIDGGGATFLSAGPYQLGGTTGQLDAGSAAAPLTGGAYALVGGFWPVANACACPGDMNADGQRDGRDIQQFATCLIAGGNCSCADIDGAGGVGLADVAGFVSDLLSGAGCP